MKKSEAEPAIKYLFGIWAKDNGILPNSQRDYGDYPSFSDFYDWLCSNHWQYTQFRSVAGPRYDIEMWFDIEFNIPN